MLREIICYLNTLHKCFARDPCKQKLYARPAQRNATRTYKNSLGKHEQVFTTPSTNQQNAAPNLAKLKLYLSKFYLGALLGASWGLLGASRAPLEKQIPKKYRKNTSTWVPKWIPKLKKIDVKKQTCFKIHFFIRFSSIVDRFCI